MSYIYATIDNSYQLEQLFVQCRHYDNWGYNGIQLLYNMLSDLSDDGEPVDSCPYKINANYTYYNNIAEYNDDENTTYETLDAINDNDRYIYEIDGVDGFIIANN